MRDTRAQVISMIAISAVTLAGIGAAAPDKDTSTAGSWSTAGNWTPSGVPVSGESVNIDLAMTVSDAREFGSSGSTSIWDDIGMTWSGGGHLKHVSGSTMIFTGSVSRFVSGTGHFVNDGTFLFAHTAQLQLDFSPTIITNNGVFDFVSSGGNGHIDLRGGAASFVNTGTLRRSVTSRGRITPSSGSGLFFSLSGSTLEATGGAGSQLAVGGGESGGTASAIINATFGGDGEVELGGEFSEISGTVTGTGHVELDSSGAGIPSLSAPSATGSTLLNITGTDEGLRWRNGSMSLVAGTVITNMGNFTYDPTSALSFLSSGTFVNSGTFRHRETANLQLTLDNSVIFHNHGTVEFRSLASETQTDWDQRLSSSTIKNFAGASMIKYSNNTHIIRRGGNDSIVNHGTVEAREGTMRFDHYTDIAEFDGSTITGGTWKVTATDASATLLVGSASITTIGSAAKVVLAEAGGNTATFAAISGLTTVNGAFGLHDEEQFSTSGALATPGTLEFGLDGSDLATALLVINGSPTFTSGTVDIVDLGIVAGTYTLISWTSAETGSLTLGSVPVNEFQYLLQKNGMTHELVVGGAPGGTLVTIQ